MFSSLGLFREVSCPYEAQCSLPNCIFAHPRTSTQAPKQQASSKLTVDVREDARAIDGARKRRRITPSSQEGLHVTSEPQNTGRVVPETALRSVSPPPRRKAGTENSTSRTAEKVVPPSSVSRSKSSLQGGPVSNKEEESLNPRMLQRPPASHATRRQLVILLHDCINRLNEEIKTGKHEMKVALTLTSQEIIKEALNEEEKIAIENYEVYANVIKLRIQKLKKMKVADWIQERIKWIQSRLPSISQAPTENPVVTIDTGLTPEEEIAFLPFLFADQKNLGRHGYVVQIPSATEIEVARRGVETAKGWEECERCKTRFQVFPGRRAEDGALTSGNRCVYHPVRARRPPPTDRADKVHKDLIYGCCNEIVGTSGGCTTATNHVFKISEAKRLAVVMAFESTPEKPAPMTSAKTAVCFDCEMGYTTQGLELLRLTATSWPTSKPLVDVLVRPQGDIIDLNSRFSGVWPTDFASAIPYDPDKMGFDDESLATAKPPRIVPSPSHARSLLFQHLTPSTPLIGHALDNDLNAARIVHPSLVDTVLLYPHPKGLPIRFGLKVLMKKHLDRDIQMGGPDHGHDSAEDANAAGDLVRLKVAKKWAAMKRDGWTVQDGKFIAPVDDAVSLTGSLHKTS